MTATKEINVSKQFSTAMRTCSWLSAVLIVCIHAYNIEVYGSQNPVLYWVQQVISQGLARGAVPFFMLSSAYFLYSRERTTGAVYLSRAKSTVVPYLLWNAVYMIAFAVLYRLSLVSNGMARVTVRDLLLGVFLHKYNYTFWFMRDLIVLIALFPMIKWVLKRGKWVSLIGIAGAIAAFCFVHEVFESLIYYYIGAWLGFHAKEQTEAVVTVKRSRLWGITAALLCVGAVCFALRNGCGLTWMEAPRNFAMALILFFAVVSADLRVGVLLTGVSFMIYALHPLVLEMIEKAMYLALPHNDLFMMASYVAAPTLCVVLITGACLLWKTWLPKVYGVFNGGRA